MRKKDVIQGAGGGGKGGSGSADFTQTPDNLRSEDVFEGLLALGQGKWKGPVKGLKSIKLNGTPLEDVSGQINFPDWGAIFSNGDPTMWPQTATLALGAGASPISIGVQLENVSGSGTPVVRTIPNTNADFIDLRFIVSTLYKQSKKGIFNETMTIKIRMKPSGTSTWLEPLLDTTGTQQNYQQNGKTMGNGQKIYGSQSYYDPNTGQQVFEGTSGRLTVVGKTTQPYVKELRIAVPNTGDYAGVGWDVECTLMERAVYDADPNFERREVSWESASAGYTAAYGSDPAWRGLAWLHVLGTASDRINGMPNVTGEYFMKEVSVPPSSVYNPLTRQYTGTVWDGSWVKEWTNDPAWVIADVISDPDSGIASLSPGSYLNKWDALELSKHCSELVSDGDINESFYVASVTNQLKADVTVACNTNISISSPPGTITEKLLSPGNRVLLTGQTNPAENGVWDFNGVGSAMTRSADFSDGSHFLGAVVYCTAGSNEFRTFKHFGSVATLGTSDVRWTSVHPRYSLDYFVDQPQKADEFIKNLAGACGAVVWEQGGGEWRCKVDKIETPVAVFTEENIEGEFSYSHTDVDTRYNDITVAYRNREFDYREDRVRVWDQADIDATGRRATTVVAVGCATRKEAYRRAMLRLRASLNEFRVVTFTTNRQGRLYTPLSTILVADKSLGFEIDNNGVSPDIKIATNLTTWTQGYASTTSIGDGFYTVTDDGPNYEGIAATSTALTAGPAVIAFKVKKDSIPNSTRFPLWRISHNGWTKDIGIDTQSGVTVVSNLSGAEPVTSGTIDDGDSWTVYMEFTAAAATVNVELYPAVGTGATLSNAGANPNTTGSVTTKMLALNNGTFAQLSDVSRNHTTGRIIAMDAPRTTITLRDPLRLEPGVTYKVKLHVPNPNYNETTSTQPSSPDYAKPTIAIERTVAVASPRGDTTTVVLTSALPADTPINAPIALEAPDLPGIPRTYRLVDVDPSADGERTTMVAIEVDTGKQAASDTVNAAAIESQVPDASCPPPLAPATGVLNLKTFNSEYASNKVLEIDWERPNSKFVTHYEAFYRFNDGPLISLGKTQDTRVEIQNPNWGFYYVEIYAFDRRGQKSTPLTASDEIEEYSPFALHGFLTNESHTLPANSDGVVSSYAGAEGIFRTYIGDKEVTSGCTFAIQANPQSLTATITNGTGAYAITGGLDVGEASASLTFRATHTLTGQTFDKVFSLAKSPAGATGTSPISAFLSNEAHTVSADSSGNVGSFAGAGGTMRVFNGNLEVTGSSTFSVVSETGVDVSIDASGNYTVASMSADVGYATLRATYNSGNYDRVYSISKSRTGTPGAGGSPGAPGADAKLLVITSDRQTISYDNNGAASPTTQTTTFTANKQNSTATVNWTITDAAGATRTPVTDYLSAATGDSVTMTEAQFAAARNGTSGVIVTGSMTDGTTFSDKISVVRVSDGTNGTSPNRVPYSTMSHGFTGWRVPAYNPDNLTFVAGFGTTDGKRWVDATNIAFPASNSQFSIASHYSTDGTDMIKVVPGERLAVSTGIGNDSPATGSFQLVMHFWSSSNVYVGPLSVHIQQPPGGSAFGTKYGGFITVPASADRAALEVYLYNNGVAGNRRLVLSEPMVSKVDADETVLPDFVPGPLTGSDAKLLFVISDRQTITYNGSNIATPATQTTTFTAQKQNTTATVTWTVFDINGIARTPTTTYLSAATGDSVTMTEAQFAAARNGTSGVIVVGTLTDGLTLTDKISVIKTQDGTAPMEFSLSATSITVAADYNGATKSGELPKNSTVVVRQGSTTITTGLTITPTASSANIVASMSGQTVQITTANAVGYVDVAVSHNTYGSLGTKRIAVGRTQDPAPPATPVASYANFDGHIMPSSGTSTSYGSAPDTALATLKTDTNGDLRYAASLSYYVTARNPSPPGTNSYTAAIKPMYRAVGGSTWLDFTSESVGSASVSISDGFLTEDTVQGIASVNFLKTDLAADTWYEIGLGIRKQASSTSGLGCTSGTTGQGTLTRT